MGSGLYFRTLWRHFSIVVPRFMNLPLMPGGKKILAYRYTQLINSEACQPPDYCTRQEWGSAGMPDLPVR
jgi:hypothetical protein